MSNLSRKMDFVSETCGKCLEDFVKVFEDDVCPRCAVSAKPIRIVECDVCGGGGFDKPGTGYDAVCGNCGGTGNVPDLGRDQDSISKS